MPYVVEPKLEVRENEEAQGCCEARPPILKLCLEAYPLNLAAIHIKSEYPPRGGSDLKGHRCDNDERIAAIMEGG